MSHARLQNNVNQHENEVVSSNPSPSPKAANVMNKTDSESCNGNGQVIDNSSNAVKRHFGNEGYSDSVPMLNICIDSPGSLIPNPKSRKVCVTGETENNNVDHTLICTNNADDDECRNNHSEMHLNSLPVTLLLKVFG